MGGFTASEERDLHRQVAMGSGPHCPRCDDPMSLTPVHSPPEVAYVRDRVILQCSSCQLHCVVDRH